MEGRGLGRLFAAEVGVRFHWSSSMRGGQLKTSEELLTAFNLLCTPDKLQNRIGLLPVSKTPSEVYE